MLVEGNATSAQRYMKFACGGNPKKFHARFPERPKSRMGEVMPVLDSTLENELTI
jgi:hypothetical protein